MAKKQLFTGTVGRTLAETRYRYEVMDTNPKSAPNVIYIVLDDMGFAQLGCYGSTINTPNIDSLAADGLRYNNFHTTAVCSATRCSLLTGANHHAAGCANLIEMRTGTPNNQNGELNPEYALLPEILKEYGYATFATGKWHLSAQQSPAGPVNGWPIQRGFDRYYGFLHGENDQYHPHLIRDNTAVSQPKTVEEGYHFSEDVVDNAIDYLFEHDMNFPNQPFFLYLAFGAMHTPHHAPKAYIDAYKGKFDEGWDVTRQLWFENQKRIGIIPQNAELTDKNEYIDDWDALNDKQKAIYAREMEAFAGMLTHTDAQIGRLIAYLKESEQYENTVIVFLSDNGASAEGGVFGRFNGMSGQDVTSRPEEEIEYNHYPIGWANAGNTPFQWYKMFTYSGGVKDPMIVRYPKKITAPGQICSQYHHVSDITPTILEVIGKEKPEYIKGVKQKNFQGTSFAYTFEDVKAVDRKHVQYYEMLGNRAIYKDGWKAIVNHSGNSSGGEFEDDRWELYHVEEDYSEYKDVSAEFPEKVSELERDWYIEAAKADVFPLLNGTLYGSTRQMIELVANVVKNERLETYYNVTEPVDILRTFFTVLNNKSHEVRGKINVKDGDSGVIFSIGNRFAGYSFYVKDNKLNYCYNIGGRDFMQITSPNYLSAGQHEVAFRLKVRSTFSGYVELYLDKENIGSVEIPRLNANSDPVATVGGNKHSSVVPEAYTLPFDFSGIIEKLEIRVDGYTQDLDEELSEFFSRD